MVNRHLGKACLASTLVLVIFAAGCLNLDIAERPCDKDGKCLAGYYCDTARNVCVPGTLDGGKDAGADASFDASVDAAVDSGADASQDTGLDGGNGDSGIIDGGSMAPVINSMNGTGTNKAINPRPEDQTFWDSHSADRIPSGNRIAGASPAFVLNGQNLVFVSKVELIGQSGQGTHEMTIVNAGMTQMSLAWPSLLTQGGLFYLKLTSPYGNVQIQVYFMRGEQGEKGPQGDGGMKGDQGEKGDAGIQGEKGDAGPLGLKGDQGASVTVAAISPGVPCAAGGAKFSLSGVDTTICNGEKGDAGAQGLQGDKGDAGEKGDTGPQGDKGDAGTQGPKGDKGDAGLSIFACTGSDCSALYNIQISNLIVSGSYTLPDCPEGYTKDARTDIVLCTRGADQMVKVGDFWIDRYEGIIVDETYWNDGSCNGAGTQYGDTDDWPALNTSGEFKFTGDWTKRLYACSKSGVTPSAYMTWLQAQEACAISGKRLCTNEEWQAAAAGTYDPGSNNGLTNTKCNTNNTGTYRNTGLAGTTPGSDTACISIWGTEDMIGNVSEKVAWWGQSGPDNGVTNGLYQGTIGSDKGWDDFSPETTGDGDGTWNLAGVAKGCDKSGTKYGYRVGLPFAAQRGGWSAEWGMAGIFAMALDRGPNLRDFGEGFRCCMGR